MEPITYLTGQGWLILGYVYFFANKQEYQDKGLRELIDAKQYRRILKKLDVDVERVEFLRKRVKEIEDQIEKLT